MIDEVRKVGAGIKIPPNAGKVLQSYGLFHLLKESAIQLDCLDMRRYQDGKLLSSRPVGEEFTRRIGAPWMYARMSAGTERKVSC